jgi:hypothetical protein
LLRVSELNSLEGGCVDADYGEVGGGIVADGVSGHAATVGKRDFDARGVVDYVAVGKDEAVGGEDEAGATAATVFGLRLAVAGAGVFGAAGLVYFHVDY